MFEQWCSSLGRNNSGVPERMVMEWLGHQDSERVRIYYHLHDDESRRRMAALDFRGGASRRSAGQAEKVLRTEEGVEPAFPETPSPGTG